MWTHYKENGIKYEKICFIEGYSTGNFYSHLMYLPFFFFFEANSKRTFQLNEQFQKEKL